MCACVEPPPPPPLTQILALDFHVCLRPRSEGGLFGASLEFPADFPDNPPVMTFVSDIWHPNGEGTSRQRCDSPRR